MEANRWHEDPATAARVGVAIAVRAMVRLFGSQQALADAAGTKQRVISYAARGENEPRWALCHRLWSAVRTLLPDAAPLDIVVQRLGRQAQAPAFRAKPPAVQLAELEASALAMLHAEPPGGESP
jgi:hypothetical protein